MCGQSILRLETLFLTRESEFIEQLSNLSFGLLNGFSQRDIGFMKMTPDAGFPIMKEQNGTVL